MNNMTEAQHADLFGQVDDIRNALGITHAIWSFSESTVGYEGDYRQMLIDNVQFFEGRVLFVYEGGWDDEETIQSPVIMEDPHMKDVFVAADLVLRQSNDSHHVFVEGVQDYGVNEDGVQVFNLYFGS